MAERETGILDVCFLTWVSITGSKELKDEGKDNSDKIHAEK